MLLPEQKNADAFDHVERTGRVEIVDDRAKAVRRTSAIDRLER